MIRCRDCKRPGGLFHEAGCAQTGYEEAPERPLSVPGPAPKPRWIARGEEQGYEGKSFDTYAPEEEAE